MDLINEPQFLWIAEEASRAPIPPDWRQLKNEDGEIMYYHVRDRKLQKEHPLILRYKDMYYKCRSYTKKMQTGETKADVLESADVKLAAITDAVMARASEGLPPTTP